MMTTTETKAAHTPGPWEAEPTTATDWRVYSDDYGTIIHRNCYPDPQVDQYVAADARLIAAAPELLEACGSILDHWQSGNFSREPELWEKLKAAIAKATPVDPAELGHNLGMPHRYP